MATPSSEPAGKPRVGVPYRTTKEELTSDRSRYQLYVDAVRLAGGEPVEISLRLAAPQLTEMSHSLDAFVLPGSPADVDPGRYGAPRHSKSADADPKREDTDFTLLDHAIAERKPVLAICYGIQSLNVFLGGSLVQDISSELRTTIDHQWIGRQQGASEPFHAARLESGSRLLELAGMSELRVNTSHHQSILDPGRNLRVAARAPDGVIEAVEWNGDTNWITGVQWHPERMFPADFLARSLFEALIEAASSAPVYPRAF
jgi:putative glutamine amidotransferase